MVEFNDSDWEDVAPTTPAPIAPLLVSIPVFIAKKKKMFMRCPVLHIERMTLNHILTLLIIIVFIIVMERRGEESLNYDYYTFFFLSGE